MAMDMMPPRRAKGGGLSGEESDQKPKNTVEQEEELAEDGGEGPPRKRGGRVKAKRKSGGSVEGKMAACRPDRRANGGSIDVNPFSAAGSMSSLPFVKNQQGMSEGGGGTDSG